MTTLPSYHLHLLGSPRIARGDQLHTSFRTKRVLALIAYLLLEQRSVPRTELVALLWPNKSESDGRTDLRWTLSQAKKLLPHGWTATRASIALQTDAGFSTDIATIRAADGNNSASLLPLISTDPLLQGFFLDDSPEFETWLLNQREWWRRTLRQLLTQRVHQLREREPARALAFAELLVAQDSWQEDGHRLVMRIQGEMGQHSAAAEQFQLCRRLLAENLGVEPSAETIALHQQIQASGPLTTAFKATPSSLPTPTTTLVGRERELAQVQAHLAQPDCRLVTITGMGGMGKTRLALALAHAVQQERTVWFVPLAGIQQTDGLGPIVDAIATALGLTFYNIAAPQQQLLLHLAKTPGLLILDNLEQLMMGDAPIVGLVQSLLHATPIQLIATSREPLQIPGEWLVELDGLPVQAAAADLFNAAAKRLKADFDPMRDVAQVERICAAVGGMPLAIELAATWLRSLTCAEIADEVSESIDILATASRGIPARHRSLHAVFDYSWRTLSAESQQTLSRLAVFRGGCDRIAAKRVSGATLHTLSELVNRSFLRRSTAGRYHLHETVRQYALEQLSPSELALAERKHANWFVERLDWGMISAEIDNIRTALRWSLNNDAALAMRFIGPLAAYFEQHNSTEEMIRVHETALSQSLTMRLDDVSKAYHLRKSADGYYTLGQFTRCREQLEQALDALGMPLPSNPVALGLAVSRQLATQMRHRRRMPSIDTAEQARKIEAVRVLDRIGQVYFFESNGVGTVHAVLKALNLVETLPISAEHARLYASTTLALGLNARPALALRYQDLALNALDHITDPASRIWGLEVLSIFNAGLGNWQQVESWLAEAMHLCDRHDEKRRKDECRSILALCYFFQGHLDKTRAVWNDMFEDAYERNDTQMRYWSAYGMLDMALRQDKLDTLDALLRQLPTINQQADRNDATTEITNCAIRALLALENNDVETAYAQLNAGLIPAENEAPTSFSMLEGYTNLIEVCFLLMRHDARRFASLDAVIARLVKALKKFASIFPIGKPAAALCEAMHLCQQGKPGKADALLVAGLEDARRLGMPYEEARLLTMLGIVHHAPEQTAEGFAIFTRLAAHSERMRWQRMHAQPIA